MERNGRKEIFRIEESFYLWGRVSKEIYLLFSCFILLIIVLRAFFKIPVSFAAWIPVRMWIKRVGCADVSCVVVVT